jgi:hypothetical protein
MQWVHSPEHTPVISRERQGHYRQARRAMDDGDGQVRDHGGMGAPRGCGYLLHDRDTKYSHSFQAIIHSGRVKPLVLSARSPNLNAYAGRNQSDRRPVSYQFKSRYLLRNLASGQRAPAS